MQQKDFHFAIGGELIMKKLLFLVLFISAVFVSVVSNSCEAKDIWVEHWNYENVDIYVMDDTITSGTTATGKYFKVVVKQVQNGKLLKTNIWTFSKWKDDFWRYKTDEMKGNNPPATKNTIFELCMKQIGWPYKVVDEKIY